MMRVRVDRRLCIGAGCCAQLAPENFEVRDTQRGPRAFFIAQAPNEALLAAARVCPTMAIRLATADGDTVFPVGWIPSAGTEPSRE